MRAAIAALTHRGSARERNEDCIAVGTWVAQDSMDSARFFEFHLDSSMTCVVADGMGGHASGELASRLVAERLAQLLRGGDMGQIAPALRKVNAEVFAQMAERPQTAGMGAAIVGLHAAAGEIGLFNVGDSRAYRVDSSGLVQLSTDDSMDKDWRPGSLFARTGVLTQSLGGSLRFQEINPHLHVEALAPQRSYLLCSDGLYETLDEEQIAGLVGADLKASVEAIAQTALRHYASDNLSVALLRVF